MVRTLMVVHTPVWPVRSGNSIRRSMVATSLLRHGPVTLLHVPLGPAEPRQDGSVAPVPVRVRPLGGRTRRPAALASDLLRDRLPTELAGHSWRRVASTLADEIDVGPFDLVWSCRAVGFLATDRLPRPVVCDLDDLEDVKLERLGALTTGRGLAAARDRLRIRAWRSLQARTQRRSDVTVVCTDDDAARLAARLPSAPPAAVVPNCFPAVEAVDPDPPPGPPELLLLGLHTYGPNADAARWFIDAVLPRVRAARPEVVVRIVGEVGDGLRRRAGAGVVVEGEVDDPGRAFLRATALVVPLRYGSGSRLKIIEAWARGVPVVTTSIGAEGLGATDGVDAAVGDGPEGLAAACIGVIGEPGRRAVLAAGGRRRYEAGHTAAVLDRHVDIVLARALGAVAVAGPDPVGPDVRG